MPLGKKIVSCEESSVAKARFRERCDFRHKVSKGTSKSSDWKHWTHRKWCRDTTWPTTRLKQRHHIANNPKKSNIFRVSALLPTSAKSHLSMKIVFIEMPSLNNMNIPDHEQSSQKRIWLYSQCRATSALCES